MPLHDTFRAALPAIQCVLCLRSAVLIATRHPIRLRATIQLKVSLGSVSRQQQQKQITQQPQLITDLWHLPIAGRHHFRLNNHNKTINSLYERKWSAPLLLNGWMGLGVAVMVLRQPQNASHAGRIDGLTQSVVVACTTIISYGPALRHCCRHRGHTFY